jgi:CheY-like chemotaxis protein
MKEIRTIAVVEDDEDDFFFTQRALRRRTGAAIVHLQGGWEAIEYLAGTGRFSDRAKYPLPEVMLVDLKMDAGTGHDILAAIRQSPPAEMPRIYILTGSNEPRDRDLVKQSGVAHGFIVKPLSEAHVERILEVGS